jgi:anti-sigma factor RsiW
MTCSEITDVLLDYVSGEMPEPLRTAFDAHLRICPDCRRYLDGYRKTIVLTRSSLRDRESEVAAMPEELVAAILKLKCGAK